MGGTYFLARVAVAFMVPLTLASLGPTQSHPELGTDMAPSRRRENHQVYRAGDVKEQAALREYDAKQRTKLQAYRRGTKIHIKPGKG